MSAFRVGLTGGLASGKTMTAEIFAKHDVAVIDADVVAEDLTAVGGDALPDLRQIFGDWAFTSDGALDRAAVRRRIFADPSLRQRMEFILHPRIRAIMQKRLRAASSPYAVGVVPLLFENDGWEALFQLVIVIDCSPQTQLARARARDDANDAATIMATQMPPDERRRRADIVIDNNGDLMSLAAAVAEIHQQCLQSAKIFAIAK